MTYRILAVGRRVIAISCGLIVLAVSVSAEEDCAEMVGAFDGNADAAIVAINKGWRVLLADPNAAEVHFKEASFMSYKANRAVTKCADEGALTEAQQQRASELRQMAQCSRLSLKLAEARLALNAHINAKASYASINDGSLDVITRSGLMLHNDVCAKVTDAERWAGDLRAWGEQVYDATAQN